MKFMQIQNTQEVCIFFDRRSQSFVSNNFKKAFGTSLYMSKQESKLVFSHQIIEVG